MTRTNTLLTTALTVDEYAAAIRTARCPCGSYATVDYWIGGTAHDAPVRWASCDNKRHRQTLGYAVPVRLWSRVVAAVNA